MTKNHQEFYKCIQPKIVETRFAVFIEEKKGEELIDLEYKYDSQDTRADEASGYVQTMGGDSGGPYWTTDTLLGKDKRSVLVAIHSDSIKHVPITTEKRYRCRTSATKITDNILRWIKAKSGINWCIEYEGKD